MRLRYYNTVCVLVFVCVLLCLSVFVVACTDVPYFVCFVICEFSHFSPLYKKCVSIRIWQKSGMCSVPFTGFRNFLPLHPRPGDKNRVTAPTLVVPVAIRGTLPPRQGNATLQFARGKQLELLSVHSNFQARNTDF